MKRLFTLLMASAVSLPFFAVNTDDDRPITDKIQRMVQADEDTKIVLGEFNYPDSVILGEFYDPEAPQKSQMRSDKGQQPSGTQAFQSFKGNKHPIKAVEAYATFADMSFFLCTDRIYNDDEDNLLEPIKLGIAFHRDNGGLPGEIIYQDSLDVMGKKSGAQWNESYKGGLIKPIYAFRIDLKEEVRMENGWVSVYAVDTGDKPSCLFTLFGHTNIINPGVIKSRGSWYGGCFCYCFIGDASKDLVDKGIKISNFTAPEAFTNDKAAQVAVQLENYGGKDVNDATLELYLNEELVATEQVDATIPKAESYTYTFKKRLDLSAAGKYTIKVANATPGDNKLVDQAISTVAINPEGTCESRGASESWKYKYITSVHIGDINNTSEESAYSDYRSMKTELRPGQELLLKLDGVYENKDYIKVWVDWNSNGLFDDAGEFIGYVPRGELTVKIPDAVNASPGEKTMRIILSKADVSPCGLYQYGETEDYTLVVKANDNEANMTVEQTAITATAGSDEQSASTFTIKSDGTADLTATYEIEYKLPDHPDLRSAVKRVAPASQQTPSCPVSSQKTSKMAKAPEAAENTEFVLTYSGDVNGTLNAKNLRVQYAQLFPGEMLRHLAGMQISSLDVYLYDKAKKTSVIVYGENDERFNGEELYKQQFNPTTNSWNHIEFDTPVTITGEDLWVGVLLEGATSTTNQIGLDRGPNLAGYGDRISVGDNYWWTVEELGYTGNVCIRANVTGKRTPAINWLSLDKTEATLGVSESDKVNLSFSSRGLAKNMYEAIINVKTNAPLNSLYKLPVYFDVTKDSGIENTEAKTNSTLYIDENNTVKAKSDKGIKALFAYSTTGSLLKAAYGIEELPLNELQKGLYVAKAVYGDGTSEACIVIVK